MKWTAAVTLAGLAAAAPAPQLLGSGDSFLSAAAGGQTGMNANDLEKGPCKSITFVYARASTEPGNMGIYTSMGAQVCNGLKSAFNNDVACQGIGGNYEAGLMTNVLPQGTNDAAVQEAKRVYNLAATKCPNTKIVGGGYSQGTAVTNAAISTLPSNVQNRIYGVVLFGYTKNYQESGHIKNFPPDKVKVFCPASDGVCNGLLLVTLGHFVYLGDGSGKDASQFLIQKLKAAPAVAAQPAAAAAPAAPSGGLAGLSGLSGLGGLSSLFG